MHILAAATLAALCALVVPTVIAPLVPRAQLAAAAFQNVQPIRPTVVKTTRAIRRPARFCW